MSCIPCHVFIFVTFSVLKEENHVRKESVGVDWNVCWARECGDLI